MSGVAHVVARASADDPATLGVLALADAMSATAEPAVSDDVDAGPTPVYCGDARCDAAGVVPFASTAIDPTTVVVYHHYEAAPTLVARLVERGAPIAVVHGAEPPEALAVRDLRALAAAGAVGLATSDAGAARLGAAGFTRVERVPPVVARDRLLAVEASESTTHHLDVTLHGPLVLNVGNLARAEPSARLVQSHHVLRTYLVRAAHLAIAVPESRSTSEAVVRRIAREIWGLRLTDAWIHRLVPGERASLVRRASVFVTTDPVSGAAHHALAAMAEGLPVVAPADASAIEHLGDGALLLPRDAGAALVAEAVAELLRDESRRAHLAAAAVRAVERFAPAAVAPLWCEALAS